MIDPFAVVVARMERDRTPFLDRFCATCHREFESGRMCFHCRASEAALTLHDQLARLQRFDAQLAALDGRLDAETGAVREASGLFVARVREHATFIAPIPQRSAT